MDRALSLWHSVSPFLNGTVLSSLLWERNVGGIEKEFESGSLLRSNAVGEVAGGRVKEVSSDCLNSVFRTAILAADVLNSLFEWEPAWDANESINSDSAADQSTNRRRTSLANATENDSFNAAHHRCLTADYYDNLKDALLEPLALPFTTFRRGLRRTTCQTTATWLS